MTTTEGEHPQLCLCISSTLLKLLTDSACSQSDDLPCCARITRTSATFANDNKSLFDQRQQSERPDKLGKDTTSTRWDRLQSRAKSAPSRSESTTRLVQLASITKMLQPRTTEFCSSFEAKAYYSRLIFFFWLEKLSVSLVLPPLH